MAKQLLLRYWLWLLHAVPEPEPEAASTRVTGVNTLNPQPSNSLP